MTKKDKPVWFWTLGISLILTFISLGVYFVLAAVPGTTNPTQPPPGDDVFWDTAKSCPVGQAIRSFNVANTNPPTCEAVAAGGGVSSVTGASGITANPATGAVWVSLTNPAKTCPAGQFMTSFDLRNANQPTCQAAGGAGTVTSVSAGTGLTASPNPINGVGTVSLITAGISTCTDPVNSKIYWNGTQLTCGSDAGVGAGLPAGTSGQTLRHDGTNWVANSTLYNNGTDIGIGTTSPNRQLHIYNTATNPEIDIQGVAGAGNHWAIYNNIADNSLRFWRTNDVFALTNAGNVGIGAVNPQSPAPNGATSGNMDVNDVYLRSIGKWASEAFSSTVDLGTVTKSGVYSLTTNTTWENVPNWTESSAYITLPSTAIMEFDLSSFGSGLYSIDWGGTVTVDHATVQKYIHVKLYTRNPDVTTTWTVVSPVEECINTDTGGLATCDVGGVITLSLSKRTRQQFKVMALKNGGSATTATIEPNFSVGMTRVFGF